MKLPRSDRRGGPAGDSVIARAVFSLGAAFLYPTLRARSFRGLVDTTVSEVETMERGARGVFSRTGSWPTPGAPGAIPSELSGAFPSDSVLTREAYTLQWSRWEIVEKVETLVALQMPADADAPPDSVGPRLVSVVREVGGIVVHSGNDGLLAELLARYGSAESFVRDTMWTLVVDEDPGS